MKIQILSFLALTASNVDSFQTRKHYRRSAILLKAMPEDIDSQAVTKDDLLGARDEIDKLLREKACGM